jgi:hypothetical protein
MNKKKPEIVNLLILTLIVVVFWIFFSVYRVFTDVPVAIVPEEIIIPLDPKFDSATLEMIKLKEYIN